MLTRPRPDGSAVDPSGKNADSRDTRLDFWRGLCLIDMVLVHLVYEGVNFGPLQRTLGEYTRFAAGGFVFVAGMGIGAIFLPRALRPSGRRRIYPSLWRRALYILCVHYAATLSFVSLDLIRGMRPEVPHLLPLIWNILLLREGGDLLPLYVILVAATPAALEMLRYRRLGWLLAAASVSIFVWGSHSAAALRFPMGQGFPVVLWQLMFTGGLLMGAALPKYSSLASRTKWSVGAMSVVAALVLWAGDYRGDFGWAYPRVPLVFCKTPLSVGEALRYFSLIFSLIFCTDLAWNRLRDTAAVKWVTPIGRRSLACYVAHAWIVGLVGMLARATTVAGWWQMLLAVPAVVGIWFVAIALDWIGRRSTAPATATAPLPAVVSRWWSIPIAGGAAVALLMAVGAATTFRAVPPTASQAIAIPDRTDDDPDVDPATGNDGPAVAPAFDPPETADIIPA